jgi:hypothetical protein
MNQKYPLKRTLIYELDSDRIHEIAEIAAPPIPHSVTLAGTPGVQGQQEPGRRYSTLPCRPYINQIKF